MKRTFLAKLQRNGLYCTIGALLLLVGIPLYQFLILIPSGYSNALATQSLALHWINTHSLLFLGYRALLFAGFAFIISMPFTLFRIIVAQEILGREADEQEEDDAKPRGAGPRQEPVLDELPARAVLRLCRQLSRPGLRHHGRFALASSDETTMLRISAIATTKAM